jgi:hypothetical protein
MMSNLLPKSYIHEIRKIERAFIWGNGDRSKHIHALIWDAVATLKCLGGHRLRNLEAMNKACLLKLG